MEGQGRREKLKTVETLVSLLLSDPNQTRKDILDRMMGKGQYVDSLPDFLKHNGRKLSRQSVYKSINFLKDAGILKEESDKTIFRINRYTVKSVTLSIDMIEVNKKYEELWLSELQKSEAFTALPENAKKMIIFQMRRKLLMDDEDQKEISHFVSENISKMDVKSVLVYMHLEDFNRVMNYLKMFEEIRTKAAS